MEENNLKKVLIVDDEEDILFHLSSILKRANYDVITTTKGKEAVEYAVKSSPDLIILDIVLPDMGGSEVASALTENPGTTHIPIIFLTGIFTKAEEEKIESGSGRHFVIAKPASAGELLTVINRIFGKKSSL